MTERSEEVVTVPEQEVARYVARVRTTLADLPAGVRDELLEDLSEHLAEVAAEGGGSLVERLGPPETYAMELRAAAGLAPPPAAVNLDQRVGAALRIGRERLDAVDRRLGRFLGYDRLSDYLRLLRPAWWVLRGYLVAMLVSVFTSGTSHGLLPRLGDSTLAALLLLAVTIPASIWLGRRSDRLGRRPRWLLNAATVLLVGFGLIGLVNYTQMSYHYPQFQEVYTDQYSGVRDVYVYDSEGRLLEGVRLFDQNGQPIRLGEPWCPEARQRIAPGGEYDYDPYTSDLTQLPYPYCPQGAPFRVRPTVQPAPTDVPLVPVSPSAPASTEPSTSAGPSASTPSPVPAGSPEAAPTTDTPSPTPTP
jgi:Predicted membrane protein